MLNDTNSSTSFESATINNWIAVISLAMAAFVIVTSEFLPVGLLTSLSKDFGASEGTMGLAVTLPGLVGAFAGPCIVFFSGRLDRKILVVLLSFLTAISCLSSGLSHSLPLFLFGRAILGIAIGGFWSFALVIARRLSTEQSGHRAAAIVGAGISLGTILGLPAGSLAGNYMGWRATFISIASFAALVTLLQLITLPKLPSTTVNRISTVKELFINRKIRYGYILFFLTVGAHFAGYTFLEPYLRALPNSSSQIVTIGLLMFGLFGLFGTFISEFGTKILGSFYTFLISVSCLMILLFAMTYFHPGQSIGYLSTSVWGLIWGLLPTLFSIWLFEAAPELIELSSGVFVFVTQASVACGSFFGGKIFDHYGLMNTFLFSSLIFAITIILLIFYKINLKTNKKIAT